MGARYTLALGLACASVSAAAAEEQPRDAFLVASEALADHGGVFIGEVHEDDHPSFLFTKKRMGDFYVQGVRVLGLEMLNSVDQDKIDAYYEDPIRNSGALKKVLTERWNSPYRFELIEEARKAGIKTVAIDCRTKENAGMELDEVNVRWAAAMRRALQDMPKGARFIVYGGFLHGYGSPGGVNALLSVPSIVPGDAYGSDAVHYDWQPGYAVVSRKEKIYSALPVRSFEEECRFAARLGKGTPRGEKYAELCRSLSAGRSARFETVAPLLSEIATLGEGPFWEKGYFAALSARLR